MQINQLERLIPDVPASSIEDLKLLLSNSETEKSCETNKLFKALIMLENLLSIFESSFTEIAQNERIVAQVENTTKKDNLVIESLELNGERSEIEDTVELLCEQVETLKQMLYYKELELQEVKQELNHVNEELCAALNKPSLSDF